MTTILAAITTSAAITTIAAIIIQKFGKLAKMADKGRASRVNTTFGEIRTADTTADDVYTNAHEKMLVFSLGKLASGNRLISKSNSLGHPCRDVISTFPGDGKPEAKFEMNIFFFILDKRE